MVDGTTSGRLQAIVTLEETVPALGDDELAVLATVATRRLTAQRHYGRLAIATDRRKADVLAALQAEVAPAVTIETDIEAPSAGSPDAETDNVLATTTAPGAAVALDVFPGARVVAVNQPAVQPPPGAWIPSSARTIDPYATEMPSEQCPVCGVLAWHRAGDGWTCGACHPPPGRGQTTVAEVVLDAALFRLAERAGFPALPLSPAVAVLAGRNAWRRFAVLTTSSPHRASALAALRTREPHEEG